MSWFLSLPILRENEYKINYEETLNYLALFILSSFTIDKARFLYPQKKYIPQSYNFLSPV